MDGMFITVSLRHAPEQTAKGGVVFLPLLCALCGEIER